MVGNAPPTGQTDGPPSAPRPALPHQPARRARLQMFAIYGTTCHLCGHDGAESADHLIPITVWPDQPIDPHAMRPAHHRPCPTCGRRCNSERGAGAIVADLPRSEDW